MEKLLDRYTKYLEFFLRLESSGNDGEINISLPDGKIVSAYFMTGDDCLTRYWVNVQNRFLWTKNPIKESEEWSEGDILDFYQDQME
jgi:hypothetical protein